MFIQNPNSLNPPFPLQPPSQKAVIASKNLHDKVWWILINYNAVLKRKITTIYGIFNSNLKIKKKRKFVDLGDFLQDLELRFRRGIFVCNPIVGKMRKKGSRFLIHSSKISSMKRFFFLRFLLFAESERDILQNTRKNYKKSWCQ